jgi:hypothetical protein
LRWHDADNWPLLRDALSRMGRADLIGRGPDQLIPVRQPIGWVEKSSRTASTGPKGKHRPRKGLVLTQHTGLPPRSRR